MWVLSRNEAEREYECALAEDEEHRPAEVQFKGAAAAILVDHNAMAEHRTIEGLVEEEREVECNRRTLTIMERDHNVMFEELGGTDSNDHEPMALMQRGTPDHEASGSGKAPVVDPSSDE